MARQLVLICDGKDCGTVLLEPHAGFIIKGSIEEAAIESPKPLVVQAEETVLCRECFLAVLGAATK